MLSSAATSPTKRLSPDVNGLRRRPRLPAPAQTFLNHLIQLGLLTAEQLNPFLDERFDRLHEFTSEVRIGSALVEGNLLTEYQLERVLAGQTYGLILGNYRLLEQIGQGGMGQVYLAEHRLMKRRVAIKVLPFDDETHYSLRERFYGEMRLLAELNHPNIVQAYDAGEVAPSSPNMPCLLYLVMERATGGDLEAYIEEHGRRPIRQACDWICQAALGLQAAHDLHLIHRDIKPSNLLLAENEQVKVVDFGLARTFSSRLTDPRALLGSVEFMPPEQSFDPSSVGLEADIYGLGSTLFWLLTGEPPYAFSHSVGATLRTLQQEPPRRLKALRPDVPEALDNLMARMLDRDPSRRPETPLAVSTALAAFTVLSATTIASTITSGSRDQLLASLTPGGHREQQVLVVDDDPTLRTLIRQCVESQGCIATEASDGESALRLAADKAFDLVLLDVRMPGLNGYEVCRRLRQQANPPRQRIVIVSGAGDQSELAESLTHGADDFIMKPFGVRQLQLRVDHVLRGKEQLDRLHSLVEHHQKSNRQLQSSLQARTDDLRQAHDALLFAMAKMAESNDGETSGHLRRITRYSLALAQSAANSAKWRGLIDARFLEQLERCAPLHDIGKIGLPDDILLKPASLSPTERTLVETHPLIGDRILEALGREYGDALDFMGMARAIVRHHHEHYDGRGYPDRLRGDAIPAAARILAVADVYDALRRQRLHKPAMSHANTLKLMLGRGSGQFDPSLLQALEVCAPQFEQIYQDISE